VSAQPSKTDVDADLEAQIERAYQGMLVADGADAKRAHFAEMAALVRQRSPKRVRDMEIALDLRRPTRVIVHRGTTDANVVADQVRADSREGLLRVSGKVKHRGKNPIRTPRTAIIGEAARAAIARRGG
jgi:hypothetical protein